MKHPMTTTPTDFLATLLRGLLEGRDLPRFDSLERDELIANVRAVLADPALLQLLGARTLDALLDRIKCSAQADRATALLIDVSRK
jgi:hypothetical protein